MPVLSEDSVLIMDGAVKLYRRERSRKWQAAFQIDGQYIRISTGKSDLDEAKQAASDSYLEYKFRQKNGVPVVSKRFSDVAKLCITEMNKQLESGVGKKVYRDYVIVLEKYLIPFFGKMHVTNITYETLQKFARWREQQMGREPKASTLNHVFAYVNFNKMLCLALGLSIVQNLVLYKKRIHHTHIHSS